MSELRLDHLEARLDAVEVRLHHVEGALGRIELALVRIDERLAATLPHLATKAELAEKPSRLYMWGVMAALTGAYTAALTALSALLPYLPHR